MDLRHNQLPWSDQIWAKINADLAQALAQSRRVRAPFDVFHVPSSTQVVMADTRDPDEEFRFSEGETTPIVELWVPFEISQAQVQNEGENFFSLDRIIASAYELGFAEDALLMYGAQANLPAAVRISNVRNLWAGIRDWSNQNSDDIPYVQHSFLPSRGAGLELFNAVTYARSRLRLFQRYEPFALILSSDLEGELHSTVPGSNSLNTPLERMKPLVTAGIFSTPVLPENSAVVVSAARAWLDIAQAMEPSVQFLRIGPNGQYEMRLVERLAFRLKDRRSRCAILMGSQI
jgi:uncharacterized linocin/CFP29 family protein